MPPIRIHGLSSTGVDDDWLIQFVERRRGRRYVEIVNSRTDHVCRVPAGVYKGWDDRPAPPNFPVKHGVLKLSATAVLVWGRFQFLTL